MSKGIIEAFGQGKIRPKFPNNLDFLPPDVGEFTFPDPYNTRAWRLTGPSNAPQSGGVPYIGYSYWPITNAHENSDTMFILTCRNPYAGGDGPFLIRFNKVTGQFTSDGPLFDSSDGASWDLGEGYYFSRSNPEWLYQPPRGPELRRFNLSTRQWETVFTLDPDIPGNRMAQAHSSQDDKAHSASVFSNRRGEGVVVFFEETGEQVFYPVNGSLDEAQVDRSGEWLVIKENVDSRNGEDNRIIDLTMMSGEQIYKDEEGAGGHSDVGYGYMLFQDNWNADPNTVLLRNFSTGVTFPVYRGTDWYALQADHISHTNTFQDWALASAAHARNSAHANELIAFKTEAESDTLVIAPVMTDTTKGADGNAGAYGRSPKAVLDVTGRYALWTSNMGGSDRLDLFMVEVPYERLAGETVPDPDPTPDPDPDDSDDLREELALANERIAELELVVEDLQNQPEATLDAVLGRAEVNHVERELRVFANRHDSDAKRIGRVKELHAIFKAEKDARQ